MKQLNYVFYVTVHIKELFYFVLPFDCLLLSPSATEQRRVTIGGARTTV
jgi:hypothetical protein